MNLDGTGQADVTPKVTDLSLTRNKTDAERRYTGNYGSPLGKRTHRDIVTAQTLN